MRQRTTNNEDGAFEPFRMDEVPWEAYSHGTRFGSRTLQLGAFAGCSHVGVNLEELPPGKQACPAHFHTLEGEHLMVLEGTLTLRLGGRTYEMSAGSYVCFPAGQKVGHALLNDGNVTCRNLIARRPRREAAAAASGATGRGGPSGVLGGFALRRL